MSNAGSALMGIGTASGDDRAIRAAKEAIESPLLEISIDGARGVLFSVTGGHDMSMHEINEAAEAITNAVDPEANIIFGANIDDALDGKMRVTVIATGFDAAYGSPQAAEIAGEGLSYFSKPIDEVQLEKVAESTVAIPDESKTNPDFDLKEDVVAEGDIWSFNSEEASEEEKERDNVPAFKRLHDIARRRGKKDKK